jgi:hypothetical protein
VVFLLEQVRHRGERRITGLYGCGHGSDLHEQARWLRLARWSRYVAGPVGRSLSVRRLPRLFIGVAPSMAPDNTRLYGGLMASVKQFQVTFDCAEPERVARFWCEVLGYVVPPPPAGFATWDDFDRALPPEHQGSAFACIDPSGAGPRLFFQRVPEGKVVKNRLHLDVRVGTGLVGEERLAALEAECARLVALGAVRVRLLPADDDNESCLVMQDIEGNEFDLD